MSKYLTVILNLERMPEKTPFSNLCLIPITIHHNFRIHHGTVAILYKPWWSLLEWKIDDLYYTHSLKQM